MVLEKDSMAARVLPWAINNMPCTPKSHSSTHKNGRTLAYPNNPKHINIAVADQQYQKNHHDYHMVKNMNIAPKNIW